VAGQYEAVQNQALTEVRPRARLGLTFWPRRGRSVARPS